MSTLSVGYVPPIPDFLEQIAESFGVGQSEALILLGQLLAAYEPVENSDQKRKKEP